MCCEWYIVIHDEHILCIKVYTAILDREHNLNLDLLCTDKCANLLILAKTNLKEIPKLKHPCVALDRGHILQQKSENGHKWGE